MGAEGSTHLQVNFNRQSLVYFAGEQITGTILFQNTREKLQLDEVCLEIVGELGYTTQEVRQNVNPTLNHDPNLSYTHTTQPQTQTYTAYHEIPFLKLPISIVQPPPGQRELTLNPGQYSWPFEFVLPSRLPPTLLSTRSTYPYVKYFARIVLHKPWYKPDTKQVFPFMIVPRVDVQYIPGAQQQVAFSGSNRKDVQVNGYLQRNAIVPTENICVHINLQNPKQSTIKRIEAVLTQRRQIAQSHEEDVIFRVDVPDLHESNAKNFERTVNLVIPNPYLAPTFQYMAQYNQTAYPVVVTYELELKVKSHGMFTDFEIKMPIIIGTEQTANPQQMNNYLQMPVAGVATQVYTEAPPSYEAVVSNEKK